MEKKVLEISPLSTIEDILYTRIPFLGHTTQKRNVAYLIQYLEFLNKVNDVYRIDRGLAAIYKYNVLRVTADVLEGLLFCGINQLGVKIIDGKTGAKLNKYIQVAKSKGLIGKETGNKIEKVAKYRNDLHPNSQEELLLKADPEVLKISETVVQECIYEMAVKFGWVKPKEIEEEEGLCPMCDGGNVPWGEVCPMCHKVYQF